MTITIDQLVSAINGANGQSKAIGGFSVAGLTTVQSRAIFIGGDDESRTPMYQFLENKQVPVTDESGADCWAVEGRFAGIRDYATKEGKYAGAKKIAIDLDFGTEKISLITGIGTRCALSVLQSLNILKSVGDSPQFLRLVFSRGKSNAKVVFVKVGVSEDGQTYSSVYTGDDTAFDLPQGYDATAHNTNLLERLNGDSNDGEVYQYDESAEF